VCYGHKVRFKIKKKVDEVLKVNNNQLFPFERNRYYAGKMLTSTDFLAEQTYMNNKRRFINTMMYGDGIICGLSVFNLDDLSIMLDSGVAVDGLGREIILENSVVKKLSAIDGFDRIKSNRVSLCIRYKEEEVHPVYSINKQEKDEEYEFNRIREGYELFLTDTESLLNNFQMETEFFVKGTLYEDGNYRVSLMMPATACKGKQIRIQVITDKISEAKKEINLEAILQAPAFLTLEGGHELLVNTGSLNLEAGKQLVKEYWLTTQYTEGADTSIVLKNDTVKLFTEGKEETKNSRLSLKIVLDDIHIRELVDREIGKTSLEMRSMNKVLDFIRLADFNLVRTDSAYMIDEISEQNAKKYIPTLAEENLRKELLEFYRDPLPEKTVQTSSAIPQNQENLNLYYKPRYAAGTLEIPLGVGMKRGEIRYSGEIMHGLGKGNVYVKVGYEYLAEDMALGRSAKNTIYGSPELFEKEEFQMTNIQTAVKVMNDKGSFIVAAKLLKETDYIMLTLRWVAIRFESDNEAGILESYIGKSIAAETPTVVLGTKESYFFHVRFNGMEECSLTYELTEPGSGEISMDGIYTAPSKEGVYEIRIYCMDMPIICTYAYAVVKKKGTEDRKV
jgi:hypothetical protein